MFYFNGNVLQTTKYAVILSQKCSFCHILTCAFDHKTDFTKVVKLCFISFGPKMFICKTFNCAFLQNNYFTKVVKLGKSRKKKPSKPLNIKSFNNRIIILSQANPWLNSESICLHCDIFGLPVQSIVFPESWNVYEGAIS